MEPELEFKTFIGRGQVRYCCPQCGFDGPTVGDVLKHWQGTHAGGAVPSGPTLFDSKGNPIESREINVPDETLRALRSR